MYISRYVYKPPYPQKTERWVRPLFLLACMESHYRSGLLNKSPCSRGFWVPWGPQGRLTNASPAITIMELTCFCESGAKWFPGSPSTQRGQTPCWPPWSSLLFPAVLGVDLGSAVISVTRFNCHLLLPAFSKTPSPFLPCGEGNEA